MKVNLGMVEMMVTKLLEHCIWLQGVQGESVLSFSTERMRIRYEEDNYLRIFVVSRELIEDMCDEPPPLGNIVMIEKSLKTGTPNTSPEAIEVSTGITKANKITIGLVAAGAAIAAAIAFIRR